MRKVSTKGRKSTTTVRKIRELGVEVNPGYLTWMEKSKTINIRVSRKDGTKAQTSLSVKAVGGDQQALFYAAAGIRNHFIRNGVLPDKKQKAKIISRSLHTQSTKDVWFNQPKDETKSKRWGTTVELKEDPSEVTIDIIIPSVDKLTSKRGRPHSRGKELKYIYKKSTGSMVVQVPNHRSKDKFFSARRYGDFESATTAAKIYRDNLLGETVVKAPELLKSSELSSSSSSPSETRNGFQGFLDNLIKVFR